MSSGAAAMSSENRITLALFCAMWLITTTDICTAQQTNHNCVIPSSYDFCNSFYDDYCGHCGGMQDQCSCQCDCTGYGHGQSWGGGYGDDCLCYVVCCDYPGTGQHPNSTVHHPHAGNCTALAQKYKRLGEEHSDTKDASNRHWWWGLIMSILFGLLLLLLIILCVVYFVMRKSRSGTWSGGQIRDTQ